MGRSEQSKMNKKSTSRKSQTAWERLDKMPDNDIDLSDIPEITKDQMTRARFRVGGKLVPAGKIRVQLALDTEVIAYFKMQAGHRNLQSLINDALKANIRHRDLEATLRRVIREELQAVG
jgi:uncharacterized protein (DUF4415 family)